MLQHQTCTLGYRVHTPIVNIICFVLFYIFWYKYVVSLQPKHLVEEYLTVETHCDSCYSFPVCFVKLLFSVHELKDSVFRILLNL